MQIVADNGGQFSGKMNRSECTHLLIDTNTGEKYNKAMQWKTVKVVPFNWLLACNKKVCFGSNSLMSPFNCFIFRKFGYLK